MQIYKKRVMKGSEVRKILKELGCPLVRIAEKMGVSAPALDKMLNVEDIKTGVLDRIAQAADKDIIFFLGDADIVRIPKINEEDPELSRMVQTVRATINYLQIFQK